MIEFGNKYANFMPSTYPMKEIYSCRLMIVKDVGCDIQLMI